MVVAQVVLTLHPGGQEYVVIQLAERLQRRGIRSPVIVLDGGSLIPEANRRGVETFDLAKGEGFKPSVIVKLRGLLRRQRADVVHTHNLAPLIYGTLAARTAGIPSVNTRHGRAALSTHRLIWRLTRAVVAVSDDARRELLAHNAIDPAKVSVILNGVDVREFGRPSRPRDDVRTALGIPRAALVFGMVARLAPEKDHATLLRAFQRVADAASDACLAIVGAGPEGPALEALSHELRLSDRVRFLGLRTDIPTLLGAMDVFVLSSTMEGISLTLLEAMAAGLPVVTTRVGGNPEVVVDGVTGLLVPAGDVEGLAAALTALYRDGSRRTELGGRGRERAAEVFEIERMVDAYVRLYSRLTSPQARVRPVRPLA